MLNTTSANLNPQHYIVSGVKFFKDTLDKLRLDASVTDQPITASEISVLMILHSYADETGQIHSLTHDKNTSDRKALSISNIARDHELVYETTKKAFDSLIARNYITEVYTSNSMYYELVDYTELNNSNNLNYFRIPQRLFEEKVFGQLIKHRYHTAPLVLLELSQYFTRQIGLNKRFSTPQDVSATRTMNYLKSALKTTAKRVRAFTDIVKNVFVFKPIDTKVKAPSESRSNRLRTFAQVCIDKFECSMNVACFKENDKQKEKETYSYAKREIANRIKNASIPLKWRDRLDINKSMQRISKIALHLDCINKKHHMLRQVLLQVGDALETLHLDGELRDIKSIGAFVNKLCSNAWEDYKTRNLSAEDRIEIMTNYQTQYEEHPAFL
ncbi:hypothetical protein HMI01_26830 [Halolactibacillus miurensis]|uniref:Uncharacterized protein n=1 Tax=Halolactibacillus miurensis TaxID=306541 RepID=A0A1I6U2W9_9BACI|nr:hypothetical protein [Halolactibacillus miurensis]GEM05695.1 hypothetical protein HMI01_26830 [Halolactibacillus miurensis]SFS95718.1 hypothetical protein SAMN05421668_12120 [Halolactibacillus miurensis]